MKKAIRIIAAPARYKFDVIQNLTDDEVRAYGQPNIREWSWHSAHELRIAALSRLSLKWTGKPIALSANLDQLFRLEGFTDLNYPPDRFTWFIDHGEGHLFVDRPPEACPFEDQDLYVPALWGKRVMIVAKQAIVSARQAVEGQKIFWEGVHPDATIKKFGPGIFADDSPR